MDGPPYRCDSSIVVNIEEVAIVDVVIAITDDTVCDVVSPIVK